MLSFYHKFNSYLYYSGYRELCIILTKRHCYLYELIYCIFPLSIANIQANALPGTTEKSGY